MRWLGLRSQEIKLQTRKLAKIALTSSWIIFRFRDQFWLNMAIPVLDTDDISIEEGATRTAEQRAVDLLAETVTDEDMEVVASTMAESSVPSEGNVGQYADFMEQAMAAVAMSDESEEEEEGEIGEGPPARGTQKMSWEEIQMANLASRGKTSWTATTPQRSTRRGEHTQGSGCGKRDKVVRNLMQVGANLNSFLGTHEGDLTPEPEIGGSFSTGSEPGEVTPRYNLRRRGAKGPT